MAIRRYKDLDYEQHPTAKELAAWRKAALTFSNKVRVALDKEPLEALVPGAVSRADRCVITMSIDGQAEGLYPRTDYTYVDIFQNPDYNFDDDHLEWPDDGTIRSEHGLLTKKMYPTLVKSIRVPPRVHDFLLAFDDGHYRDLIDDNVVLPMPE